MPKYEIILLLITLIHTNVFTVRVEKVSVNVNKMTCDLCITNGPFIKFLTKNILTNMPDFFIPLFEKSLVPMCPLFIEASEVACYNLMDIYRVILLNIKKICINW